MSITVLIAATCVTFGVVCMAWAALSRRPLSDPQDTKPTLEPKGQGLRFLGLPRNALGLGLILIGLALFVVYAWTD